MEIGWKMWKRRWESPKKRLHLMIFNSLLQLSINVGMKPGLVMKPLPKSLDVVSLGKVLGNKTETWMISVCMSEHVCLLIGFLCVLGFCLCVDFISCDAWIFGKLFIKYKCGFDSILYIKIAE